MRGRRTHTADARGASPNALARRRQAARRCRVPPSTTPPRLDRLRIEPLRSSERFIQRFRETGQRKPNLQSPEPRMYVVTKRIEFCYGHRLLDYDGVCKHPHGHNAVAEIDVRTDELDKRNMVAD